MLMSILKTVKNLLRKICIGIRITSARIWTWNLLSCRGGCLFQFDNNRII